MNVKTPKANVGCVVARFQVPYLTEVHKELVDTVLSKHAKVLIFLGISAIKGNPNDPLEFQPRKQMLLEQYPSHQYPNLHIAYIKDNRSDEEWSKNLDILIRDQLSVNDKVVLYGSRDSFLPHYKGTFQTVELEQTRDVSGTELRAQVAQAPQSDPKFRMGVIWLANQSYPTVYSTVDVLVFDPKERRVLLGRKPNEKFYRIVGGFADVEDDSFEQSAARELYEETKLTVGVNTLAYLGSKKINDWRYRNNPKAKIITHLYVAPYSMGSAKASDDIAEVRWMKYDGFNPELVLVEEHQPLWPMVKKFIDAEWPDRFDESVKLDVEINESFRREKIVNTNKS
jgi:bifunctional NMN adenylyltransferase/nudix hydrolase